jgi:hypothetical protein
MFRDKPRPEGADPHLLRSYLGDGTETLADARITSKDVATMDFDNA